MPHRLRTPVALIALVCLPAALAGCGDRTLADRLGMGKRSPDEFAIVKRAPLVRPPHYELRPPRPGAPRPQEPAAPEAARAARTGVPAPDAAVAATLMDAGTSPGQRALLAGAGAAAADPLIRDRLDAEGDADGRVDDTLFGDLLGVNDGPPPGTVIDAAAEAERLRANQAAGLPPSAGGAGGGEAPSLTRRGQTAL
jgi:hypothetical protein